MTSHTTILGWNRSISYILMMVKFGLKIVKLVITKAEIGGFLMNLKTPLKVTALGH